MKVFILWQIIIVMINYNRTPASRSSDFVKHWYDYRPNWTLLCPITIIDRLTKTSLILDIHVAINWHLKRWLFSSAVLPSSYHFVPWEDIRKILSLEGYCVHFKFIISFYDYFSSNEMTCLKSFTGKGTLHCAYIRRRVPQFWIQRRLKNHVESLFPSNDESWTVTSKYW